MRGLKSFALLLAVALGLGAYLYFVESKKEPGDAEPKKEKVFTVDGAKIDEVTIKAEAGQRTTLVKNGADWRIVQPIASPPDPAEISGVTSNLASVEIQRVIDDNPADLKEFGLAEPRIEVSFKADGKQHTLQIGQKTPTGTDLYAKRADDKKVFLIPSFLDATFNRTTFDLRDKTVVKVDPQAVETLEVAAGGQTLKFAKHEGEWEIQQPFAGRADFGAVESLINKINSTQMKSIIEPPSADLKTYGLDKPSATIRVGSASAQAALAIGARSTEGAVYARDLSRPAVFTIDSTLLDDLKKEPGEYRQKDLFDARPFNTRRIDIARNGQTVAFERATAKDKDGKEQERWRQVLPSARDVDTAKVEALVSVVTGARAMGFVTPSTRTNLDKPELTITLKDDRGKEERVTFARNGADGFAERAGSPGAATVETATIDSIIKALDEIK